MLNEKNYFTQTDGALKTTRGMLVLEFKNELIKELREHFLSKIGE